MDYKIDKVLKTGVRIVEEGYICPNLYIELQKTEESTEE